MTPFRRSIWPICLSGFTGRTPPGGKNPGLDLGLAIADTIAREHKGALKAESDAASTRFTFTIPLRKQA